MRITEKFTQHQQWRDRCNALGYWIRPTVEGYGCYDQFGNFTGWWDQANYTGTIYSYTLSSLLFG